MNPKARNGAKKKTLVDGETQDAGAIYCLTHALSNTSKHGWKKTYKFNITLFYFFYPPKTRNTPRSSSYLRPGIIDITNGIKRPDREHARAQRQLQYFPFSVHKKSRNIFRFLDIKKLAQHFPFPDSKSTPSWHTRYTYARPSLYLVNIAPEKKNEARAAGYHHTDYDRQNRNHTIFPACSTAVLQAAKKRKEKRSGTY